MPAAETDVTATGPASEPARFSVRRLQTSLEWSDLVLSTGQLDGVETILAWTRHRDTLLRDWGLANRIPPGYRALFRGPAGSGKALTAALLGKASGLIVYQLDLAAVRSRYIDETTQNIARIFDLAESEEAILYLDEGEALFGKRSDIKDAHDRYADAALSYLLRRIEDFPGTVIVAANIQGDIDHALARRFDSIVCFPLPAATERLRLWRQALSGLALAPDIDLERMAAEFEIGGGAIARVLRHACLKAVRRGERTVQLADLRGAATQELHTRDEPA